MTVLVWTICSGELKNCKINPILDINVGLTLKLNEYNHFSIY